MNRTVKIITLSLGLVALACGCKADAKSSAAATGNTADEARATPPAPAKEKQPAPAPAPAASGKVKRIVFVDKARACKCTKDRIDASYKALTAVVGFPPVPDVERIHMDTQEAKAAPYKAKRPIMVPPAIYFLGEGDKLVEVLQGEVTEEQIRKVLK